jgi:hypothetical protein
MPPAIVAHVAVIAIPVANVASVAVAHVARHHRAISVGRRSIARLLGGHGVPLDLGIRSHRDGGRGGQYGGQQQALARDHNESPNSLAARAAQNPTSEDMRSCSHRPQC